MASTVVNGLDREWAELVARYRVRRPGRDEQGHYVRDDEAAKVAGVLTTEATRLVAAALHRPGDAHAIISAAEEAASLLRLAMAWWVDVDRGQKSRGFAEEFAEGFAAEMAKEVERGTKR